jgi:hypothetical protein
MATEAVAPPVDLKALLEDDFAVETAEMRFARRHHGGGHASHDDPKPVTYAMDEGVWRPDGKGANDTIYKPFYWKGRKVRALKPAAKFRRGEQWSFPGRVNVDRGIGVLTGDARFTGDAPVAHKTGDRFNRFQHLQRFGKNRDSAGAATDALYGVGEPAAVPGMVRDQVLAELAQEGSNPAQARPLAFLRKDIQNQTAGELGSYVEERKVQDFLLDPGANWQYNELAMGATVIGVNDTGDYNLAADNNFGRDRPLTYARVPVGQGTAADDARRAGRAAGAAPSSATGTLVIDDTLNAVKVRTADMQGVNTWGASDGTGVEVDGDGAAIHHITHSRNQARTTKNLFNRNGRAPDLGLSTAEYEPNAAPLSGPRQLRRKELDRGAVSAAHASAEQDAADEGPLAAARRYRRKELDRGAMSASQASGDQDGADEGPLAAARRFRRKELDRGAVSASHASGDQDGADEGPLSAARRYRRKELDRGAMSAAQASGGDQDVADEGPLTTARRYRRKEIDRMDAWSGTSGIDLGDTQHRHAAPRKRFAETARRNEAAMFPGASISAGGEVAGSERRILLEVPSQAGRAQERYRQRRELGVGALRSTEMEQFAQRNRVDPSAQDLLSRTTQQVGLRDRRHTESQIAVRGYDEMSALKATYANRTEWMRRGRGKIGQGAVYESGVDSSAGED